MTTQTQVIIEAAIKADAGMTEAEKADLLKRLKTEEDADKDKVLSVAEVARRIRRTRKTVHLWCRQGYLQKVTIGKNSRASGILESSLAQWLCKAQTAKAEAGNHEPTKSK